MPCTGCRATLRVPPGAAAIRCPACKTVITLAAAIAEPAAVPSIPLPFGAPPAAPSPPPQALPIARATPVRAAEYRDDDPEPDRELSSRDKPVVKRNSLLDFDDDELTDDERREKRRLERLWNECVPARTGATTLAYAYGIDAIAYLLGFLYLVVASFGSPLALIALGGVGLHVIALCVQIVALGFCCRGPRQARGIAIFGLITTVMALLTLVVAGFYASFGLSVVGKGAGLFEGGSIGHGDMTLWLLAPLAPALEMLSFPLWAADGTFRGGAWFMFIPGLFDIARHTYATVLMRHYCEEGKAPTLGWNVSRFMTRIYAAFGSFFVTRLIACGIIASAFATRDDSALLIFLGLSYAGGIAGLAVAMVAQAYVLTDAAEVIDYKRFALKSGRLDVV
jgi:LSD1 subclass zinc finger protein